MARIRTIKPEFFTSLTVASLTAEQRLTFIGLWTHCDDLGRCVDDARLIKAALWPLDDRTAADVAEDLGALSEASLITRYILKRKSYIAITGWSEHQRINRPTPSRLPSPDDPDCTVYEPLASMNECSCMAHGGLSEDSRQERKGTGNREQGTGIVSVIASEPEPLPLPIRTAAPPDAMPRVDVEKVCAALADSIEANTGKRPGITGKWRDSIRLMIDKDAVPLADILSAIEWAAAHEFWRSVVLSAPKLREKYQQMSLQAQRGNAMNGRPKPSTTDERVAGWVALGQQFREREGAQ